jgi:AcrR family transcriptional regulator
MARARRPYTPRMPIPERREQLLDAALHVIARDGYGGVSIDAIAREADVTRPVVYSAFGGLEPLLYALLDRQEQRALAQLAGAVPLDVGAARDPVAFASRTVRALYDLVAGDPLTWRPILLTPEGTPPPVRERIARDRELVRGRVQSLLELVLASMPVEAVPPGLDTEVVSHALLAIAEYFGRRILEEPEPPDRERLAATVQALLTALR